MTRRILPGSAVLVLALVISGCAWFGPNVDEVKPGDLRSFTAGAVFASDKNAVLGAVEKTTGAASDAADPMYGLVEAELPEDAPGGLPSVSSFRESFNVLIQQTVSAARAAAFAEANAASRAVVVDDNSDFSNDKDQKLDLKITITNETVNAADEYISPASGSATVESFLLELVGRARERSSTSFEASGTGDQEMTITYTEWTTDGDVVIHDGRVNTAADGKVDVKINEVGDYDVTGSISWRFRAEMSAGFSVSSAGQGGKLIMRFSYRGRDNVSFDSRTGEDPFDAVTGEFEAEMVVRLYDNDNKLVVEHRFRDDEVFDTGDLF